MKTKPPSKGKPTPDHLNPESLTWRANAAVNRLMRVSDMLSCNSYVGGILEEIAVAKDQGEKIPKYLGKVAQGGLLMTMLQMNLAINREVLSIMKLLERERRDG